MDSPPTLGGASIGAGVLGLGAVIIAAAIGLVNPDAWRELWASDRVEVTIAAVTTVGVLEAIVFAVGLSIVDVARRSALPHDAVVGWVEG